MRLRFILSFFNFFLIFFSLLDCLPRLRLCSRGAGGRCSRGAGAGDVAVCCNCSNVRRCCCCPRKICDIWETSSAEELENFALSDDEERDETADAGETADEDALDATEESRRVTALFVRDFVFVFRSERRMVVVMMSSSRDVVLCMCMSDGE